MKSKTFPKFPKSWLERVNYDELLLKYVDRAFRIIEAENLSIRIATVTDILRRTDREVKRRDFAWAEMVLAELTWKVNFERTQQKVLGQEYWSQSRDRYWE